MRTTYTLEIKAPIEKVFDLVDNDEKIKLWMEGLEETLYPEGQNREQPIGTKFTQRIREGGRITEYEGEVTAYEKPYHLGVRIGSPQFSVDVDYRLTSTAEGTRLVYSAEGTYHSTFARIMGSLFGWLTNRILDKQMNKLKELAEGRAKARPV